MTSTTTRADPGTRTGRPPLTSRAALLDAARQLAETVGFAAATVGAVTAAVGVKYSTFYRHFPSLDQLTADLVDDILAAVEVPAAGTWRDRLVDVAVQLVAAVHTWDGLADAINHLAQLDPGQDAQRLARLGEISDQVAAVLVDAGVEDTAAAAAAADTLLAVTTLPPERACPGAAELVLDGIAAHITAQVA